MATLPRLPKGSRRNSRGDQALRSSSSLVRSTDTTNKTAYGIWPHRPLVVLASLPAVYSAVKNAEKEIDRPSNVFLVLLQLHH